MNGKGSKPRPLSVPREEFENNWDTIFNKKKVVVPIKTLDNGDQFIEIPEDFLKKLNWKEGDEILWKEESLGKFKLIKK